MRYCPRCRTRYPGDQTVCPRDNTALAPDPLLGWVVARRRLDAVIGEGAQAVVYRATHVELHREEVVKILKNRSGNLSPERFAREARVLASMSTEHVVHVHDYGQTADGEHFLVMELVRGESLRAIMERDGPLPLARALNIVEQLCLGLAEAHRLGVIHRDLKPDNVLLEGRKGASERVKIVDFGIAHDRKVGLTLPGRIFGTPGYLAPEQLRGLALDSRADLFAVGVLLYEMLAGFNPIAVEGANPAELLTAIAHRLTTPVAPLSTVVHGLAPEVDTFVSSLVALERNDRPDDAGAVALRAAELRYTVAGAAAAAPELKALTDELSEQAIVLAAERVAVEGRMRALARKEQAIEVAHHRLMEEASRPPMAVPPAMTPPDSQGGLGVYPGGLLRQDTPSGVHPHPGLLPPQGARPVDPSAYGGGGHEGSSSGLYDGSSSGLYAVPTGDGSSAGHYAGARAQHPSPAVYRHPPVSQPPQAVSPPGGPRRDWASVVMAVGLVVALTAALAVLLIIAFDGTQRGQPVPTAPASVAGPAPRTGPGAPAVGPGAPAAPASAMVANSE